VRALTTEARGEVPEVGLRQIAWTFLSIGLASFSLAALGEAKDQMTRKRRWFTDEEYMQGLGLAQLMPGAPTVNLSSYLGYRLRGLPGAAAATVSFLIPCFFLMLLLSYLYLRHGQMPVVAGLFHGLAALVVGLVFNTVLNLWRSGVKTTFNWVMAFTGFALVFWLRLGLIKILLIAAGASILVVLLTHRFPALGRWTGARAEGSARTARAPFGGPQKPQSSPVARVGASACGAAPLRLDRRHTVALVAWLALVLAVDLLLIHLRPELMQMGTRFLRIGALVFGSGYAMLPFIQDAVVNQSGWLTNEQFAVALALSLVTPGPVTIIGVFIGYKVAGVVGALAGVVNMYFPAWAMTTVVAGPYARAGKVSYVAQVTQGIVAAFIGTLIVVLVRLASDTLVGVPAAAMAVGAFVAQRFGKVGTLWIVLAGALISLMLFRA
jgi:chromate transporter